MHIGPVIAVSDLEAARDFYEAKPGLTGKVTPGGWQIEADEGTLCYLLPETPGAGSVEWPVASFRIADLRAKVRELRSKGVPFLGSDDLPFALDDDGISADTDGMRVAWMRDPDGSVLTIFELTEKEDDDAD